MKTTKTTTTTKKTAATPTPVPPPAPAPAPAPVAPAAPAAPVMGQADVNSKRVTAGTPLTAWRVVANQRKNVTARYYVQGGSVTIDPINGREMFAVAIEIPFVVLHDAKVMLAAKLAAAKKVA